MGLAVPHTQTDLELCDRRVADVRERISKQRAALAKFRIDEDDLGTASALLNTMLISLHLQEARRASIARALEKDARKSVYRKRKAYGLPQNAEGV